MSCNTLSVLCEPELNVDVAFMEMTTFICRRTERQSGTNN
jgi:hypothetical protein